MPEKAIKKASTIYLQPEIHKALKLRAVSQDCSISQLTEEVIKSFLIEELEHLEDLKTVRKRKKEPSIDFESFVKKLKKDGKI